MTEPTTSYPAGLRARLARPGNPLTRLGVGPRRALVALAAGGALAGVVAPWVSGEGGLALASTGFLVLLLAAAAVDLSTRTVFSLPAAALDERSRHRRERAAYVAVRAVVAPLLGLAAVLLPLVVEQIGPGAGPSQLLVSGTSFALALIFAPIGVLAWTEPAPLLDDDDAPVVAAGGPVGAFPWSELLRSGLYFGLLMAAFRMLGVTGESDPPAAALLFGLLSGLGFAALMALYLAWSRRHL